MSTVENWSPQKIHDALEAGQIVLIDVRTPAEYMIEHIDGALLMPMAFFEPRGLPDQNAKRIVLHCGSGARSGKVAEKLLSNGIDRIAHMEGGFGAWKKAGLPYRGTDMTSGAPVIKKEP